MKLICLDGRTPHNGEGPAVIPRLLYGIEEAKHEEDHKKWHKKRGHRIVRAEATNV